MFAAAPFLLQKSRTVKNVVIKVLRGLGTFFQEGSKRVGAAPHNSP